MTYNLPPKLVLFDCDGVLVDSERVAIQVLVQDFRDFGLEMDVDEAVDLFTGGTFRSAGEEARRRGAAIPDNWAEGFYPRMYAALADGVPLVDGVVELIDRIEAQGVQTGIVSNGAMEKMAVTLTPHGLMDRFEGQIFSAYTYGVSKPNPELVWIATRHFGVDPADAAFVDDSRSGCQAGQAAGVFTVGYAADAPAAKLAPHANCVVTSMTEIAELLALDAN